MGFSQSCRYQTCACPFVWYFCMLFWVDITINWHENIVYFFNWEKTLFWTNKKFVYILNFHQQITVISSLNCVRKYYVIFGAIFWDIILGWYYNILGWKLCKQTSYWSKTVFFSQLKIITNFHPKITSQNIIRKDTNKPQISKRLKISTLNGEKKLFGTNKKFVYIIFIPKYNNIIPK